MAVYIIVFALGGALFFGLRSWDRRMRAQRALLPAPGADDESLGDMIEANVDNLEFAADVVLRAARRVRADDGPSSSDDGGGDGG